MKKTKGLLISAVLSASVIGSQHGISNVVKASQVSIIPNVQSNAYNTNNIFTKCGYKGQCTWFTYGRVTEKLGINLPSEFYGNAVEWWYANAKSNVYSYGSEPKENSIAVWGGGNLGYGHVGFVEKVEGNTVYLNEGNFNIRKAYDGNIKALSKESMEKRGNLYLKGYIYLSNNSQSSNNSSKYTQTNNNSNSDLNNYNVMMSGRVNVNSSLNVRNGASVSYNIIGSLKNNDKVYILGESNGWYKIKYNNSIGYISSRYVNTNNNSYNNTSSKTTSEQNSNENFSNESFKGIITLKNSGSYLNVRNSPNTSSSVIGSLKHGSVVQVLGKLNNWYKIKYNNSTAYISSQYVNSATNTNINTTVNVNTNYSNNKYGVVTLRNKNSRLNVRDNSSISGKVICSIPCGTKVQILGTYNGWYKIKYGYITGFASTTYIK
ncbi:bacteriocin BCN5 [Clostridium acetireducens DSM 10703]|jgi:uncharacterized protein YgiM (DUF1202 family)|uniref:N-acetylmuramoyl-L-alanine amidase n=1 Tax=Clostridium acetireducens DSM 10703 TaxID=1121290 RepID=A0A1E8F0R8_9CLOT|nr:SH3 domain-containing protein [Clostridium acetireducens]OFI07016.1 bacteriocin BCN5 [Clostridium acetireducens DSM 10703]